MRGFGLRGPFWLAIVGVIAALFVVSAGGAPTDVTYGVSLAKGCNSPTFVGQKDTCFYVFSNAGATSGDTVTVSSVVDTVANAGGPTSSSNLLSQLSLVFSPAPARSGRAVMLRWFGLGHGRLAVRRRDPLHLAFQRKHHRPTPSASTRRRRPTSI